MPRSEPPSKPPRTRHPLRVLFACLAGLAGGLALSRSLPLVGSTLLSTLVLAGGAEI